MAFTLSQSVVVEPVGSDFVVLGVSPEALLVSGPSALALARFLKDPTSLSETEAGPLLEAGVLSTEAPGTLSRRGVLAGGVATVGAGVVAISLPTAAAASSLLVDYLQVFIYVSEGNYNQYASALPAIGAEWPAAVDPDRTWTFSFGGKTLELELFSSDGQVQNLVLSQFGSDEGFARDFYELLKGPWGRREIIKGTITSGSDTLDVFLYPFSAGDREDFSDPGNFKDQPGIWGDYSARLLELVLQAENNSDETGVGTLGTQSDGPPSRRR